MIVYHPFEGDISSTPVKYAPKSCFVMTELGDDRCPDVVRIRKVISRLLKKYNITEIDANSTTTGGDYMTKNLEANFFKPNRNSNNFRLFAFKNNWKHIL